MEDNHDVKLHALETSKKAKGSRKMIVALHSAPKGFFKTSPPYTNDELVQFVQKAAHLGFKAIQIGPLNDYETIKSERLRKVLDSLNVERNVHVGGLFDAHRFALTDEEYTAEKKQIHYGIKLCMDISSAVVSVHPPFFSTVGKVREEVLSEARKRFLKLMEEEVGFASRSGIRVALESFCYPPFIFKGLHDFFQFVSNFPPEKLGVLLDAGHLYQIGINIHDAVNMFKQRLLDIHVHDATLDKDYKEATHLPIGSGTFNFQELIDLLRENAYRGWLTLEIRGTEKEILASKEYLEHVIETPP
jgi:sugar phosphate isomerase/epimerase